MVEELFNPGEKTMHTSNFGLSLTELNVTNFATFSNQTVTFDKKFNAIIGETGSGKSLILEALQLILGQRADKKIIRKDSDCAIVEATFKCACPRITKYLNELGFPFENEEVVIKRLIYKSGKTKSYLNLQTCSLATIVNFTSNFVDLVGQFENQKLLSAKYQLQLLDEFAGLENLLEQYKQSYSLLNSTQAELEEIKTRSANIAQRSDYLDYQIEELDKLAPTLEDENSLILKKKEFQDQEAQRARLSHINAIFEGLDESSDGLIPLLKKLEKEIEHSNVITSEETSQFYTAQTIISDLNYSLNAVSTVEINENEFESVIDRLDHYQTIKRKFKVDTNGLQKILEGFKLERAEAENLETSIELYLKRVEKLKIETTALALQLHNKRINSAVELSEKLTNCIQSLNMNGATIQFQLIKTDHLGARGYSEVKLISETNPGEGFFLLKDIASGGELSRILLSIRNVLSSKDSISIFLFDEIDTGIGGETALTIGKTLAQIAESSQVIAITHLPQIANSANKLVIVSKELIADKNDKRTVSLIKEVQGLDIAKEVLLMTPLN